MEDELHEFSENSRMILSVEKKPSNEYMKVSPDKLLFDSTSKRAETITLDKSRSTRRSVSVGYNPKVESVGSWAKNSPTRSLNSTSETDQNKSRSKRRN